MEDKCRNARSHALTRDRKGAALAEYVVILLLIAAASLGLVIHFGNEIRDTLETATDALDDPSGYDLASNVRPGDEGDEQEPAYDPKGGKVDMADIEHGCPLTAGSEYFADHHTTQLPIWTIMIHDPASYPEPAYNERGGPWYPTGSGVHVRLPADVVFDTYFDRDEPFFWTGNYWFKYTGRIDFSDTDGSRATYSVCSDRSLDGPRKPAEDPAGDSSTTAVAPSGAFDGSSAGLTGYIDSADDHDWYRLDITEGSGAGAIRGKLSPFMMEGRSAQGLAIALRDSSGALVEGTTSSGKTVMANSLPAGTYYVDVSNASAAYGGMGGYTLQVGHVADTPETYAGAADLSAGESWIEDIPSGDAGDRFHLSVGDTEEKTLLATAIPAGDDPLDRVRVTATKVTNGDTGAAETLLNTNGTSLSYLFNHVTAGRDDYYLLLKNSTTDQGSFELKIEEVQDVSPYASRAESLPFGERLEARLFADNDVDMFTIDNPEPQQVRIEIYEQYGDTIKNFTVFDQAMTPLGTSSNTTRTEPGELLFDMLPAGKYYIRVKAPYGGTDDYSILVEAVEDTPGVFEGAGSLTFGSTHTEDLATKVDVDMFRLTNPAEQHVLAKVVTTGKTESLTIVVYDGQTREELGRNSASKDARVLLNDLPSGDYFISVESTNGDYADYALVVNAVEDSPASIAGADASAPFPMNSTRSEHIIQADDVDVYRFIVPDTGGDVSLVASGTETMVMTLYDAAGTAVSSDTDRNPSILASGLAEGTYYLGLRTRYKDVTNYSLTISMPD